MDGVVSGDKGKLRSQPKLADGASVNSGDEALWAVVLTRELWRKGVWCVSPQFVSCYLSDVSRGMTQNLSLLSPLDAFIQYQRSRALRFISS